MSRLDQREHCSTLSVIGWVLLTAASIPTTWAQSVGDQRALATIESLKDGVVERLAKCETKGRPDRSSLIVTGKNREPTIGRLQFQPRTVVNYTKLIEGRTIDRKEAVRIALDDGKAANLAKKIIFEKNGLGNWHVCSKKLRLAPEVKRIQSMVKQPLGL